MHHEEIELNFDASCQQILGLELEILWEARSTPTLVVSSLTLEALHCSLRAAGKNVHQNWGRHKYPKI
jgi:hypothetical protein